ncbi:hypothetical protein FHR92_004633 [Fontibacillus solani]|uniref:Uncharacterized protein n=1 Tax=Fontibacillus solani TaxID=1572857 RepID=A0A7W3SXP7_9BACL|nr:hypothetical protein [Fontibacillus solani]
MSIKSDVEMVDSGVTKGRSKATVDVSNQPF